METVSNTKKYWKNPEKKWNKHNQNNLQHLHEKNTISQTLHKHTLSLEGRVLGVRLKQISYLDSTHKQFRNSNLKRIYM